MKHIQRIPTHLTRAVIAMGQGGSDAIAYAQARGWADDTRTIETITKGSVVPASTTVGTAALAQTAVQNVAAVIGPVSAFGQVARRSVNLTIDRSASIQVPGVVQSATGLVFVAQGAPIPMRQLSYASVTLDPKKMGVGIGLTRELAEGANAEVLMGQAIVENCSLAMDTLLLDTVSVDTTRPAGLRNGVSAITATAGGGVAALIKDLSNIAVAIAPVCGSMDNIIFLAAPSEAVRISLYAPSSFKYPVFATSGLAAGVVMGLATNCLAIAADPEIRIQTSKEATMHFEDTSPAPISAGVTVATPVRSLWQTDSIGLRLIFTLNWALRTTGAIAWTTAVTW
jgi:hypothetical protein